MKPANHASLLQSVSPGARFAWLVLTLVCVGTMASCGGGGGSSQAAVSTNSPPSAAFAVATSTNTVSISANGSVTFQVTVTGQGSFAAAVVVTVSGLPTGIRATPSPLTVNVPIGGSATGNIELSADATVYTGQTQITIQGSAGSMQATTHINVSAAGRANPIARTVASLGGVVERGFYDEVRGLLFVSNPVLNEVDVLNGGDLSIRRRIVVPQPFGIDQMADGKTLVVGTFTPGIYLVDEDTFVVSRHLAPTGHTLADTLELLVPVAMANGKVLVLGKEPFTYVDYIFGGQRIVQWDSATDLFTTVSPGLPDIFNLARSADHRWALLSSDHVYLYSSDRDDWISSSNYSPRTSRVAVNADGTQFAVLDYDGTLLAPVFRLYDQQLNLLGQIVLSEAPIYGQALYSPSGNRLYSLDQGGADHVATPMIEVSDTASMSSSGLINAGIPYATDNVQTHPVLLAVTKDNRAYLAISGGYVVDLDCSAPKADGTLVPNYLRSPSPSAISLAADVPVVFSVVTKMPNATFGFNGQPATSQTRSSDGSRITVHPPQSWMAGPASISMALADGESFVLPQGFVYGASLTGLSATIAPSTGSPQIYAYGFGLLNSDGSAPAVTVGGVSIVGVTGGNTDKGTLQYLRFRVPSGLSGGATATVTSSGGTATLSNWLTYTESTNVLQASGVLQLIYDEQRNQVYALKATSVEILNPATLTWKAPIAANAGANYSQLLLTSDGTKLVVYDGTHGTFTVVDPDHPSPFTTTASTLRGPMGAGPGGKIIVRTLFAPVMLDLDTWATSPLNLPLMSYTIYGSSADGLYIAAAANDTGGEVVLWNAVDGTSKYTYWGGGFWSDIAMRRDGSQIAAVDSQPGYWGSKVGFFDPELHYLTSNAYPDLGLANGVPSIGALYSPKGHVLILTSGDAVDFFDTETGTLRARLLSPEPLLTMTFPVVRGGSIVVDPSGRTIYALSSSGISVMRLTTDVDSLPQQVWSQ